MENTTKNKLKEAGAFWIKKSKTGNSFLTGSIKTSSGEEIKVIVFKNKYKNEGSNQPDYRVYFDEYNPNANKIPSENSSLEKKQDKTKSLKKEIVSSSSIETEEIPF